MALEIKLNQKLTQSLVMTPQLRQAIKMLQMGREDCVAAIEKEMLENPVLENAGTMEDSFSSLPSVKAAAEQSTGENDRSEVAEANWEKNRSNDYQDLPQESLAYSIRGRGNNSGGELPGVDAVVSSPEGLSSHLLWQLRVSDLASDDYEIAAHIIGNLDGNGYLSCPLEEIAQTCHCDADTAENVLSMLQSLDPPGVGARDLKECLLIQLERLGLAGELVGRLVGLHLDKLEKGRLDEIAKIEGVSIDDVRVAVGVIRSLEPRPGRPFADEAPIYVTPDVYVRKLDGEWIITLNDAGMPKLRISSAYSHMLATSGKGAGNEKAYLKDKIRSATWLMKSIQQRRRTIYLVTESIVKFQREFLEKGIGFLRPLVLREVAEDVGLHESTVSRVTSNKYVHTPQGVFELKYFFSAGLQSDDGMVSAESVKGKIKTLIDSEDETKPLSDQEIVKHLKAEGITIARRTVAKYRESLNILSSSKRRKRF